ncbi:MAG: helix-turn-helix transcriptional regulator, partial [Lachnospiraceae bacterium]
MNQEKIGKFIATCRKEKKLTQFQLAEKLNITNRAISKWETGKSMPDPSIMLELCELLNITVNELLTGERLNMENY